jgi:uncharacterized LabA/DUF88 family protein
MSEETGRKDYKDPYINNNNMLPGDPKGSPDEFFNQTLVFIDSGFLSKVSNHLGKGKSINYDIITFSNRLAEKQKLSCKKIFYYTAPPYQGAAPTENEVKRRYGYDKFIDKLRKREAIVREGRCQRLKIGGKYIYKQKGVDILLAMDLMSVTSDFPKVRHIILIASDSDFVPIVEKLKEQNVKTILYTYYERKRNTNFSRSNHLIKSAHKYSFLSKNDFSRSPL